MGDDVAPPIFVIGSPRSGTTLTRIILNAHPNISCGPESHFLIDLRRVAEEHWNRVERFGIEADDWDRRVRALFEGVHLDYMARHGGRRWAEKTPRYTLHLDYIDRLFPEAKYIHIIRDGRDVVASHRDRWGYKSAVAAPAKWATHVEAAQSFGEGPAAGRYHEIRYESLVREPEATLRPMFEFLDEPWDDSVLAFDQNSQLASSRREEGGDQSLIYSSRIGSGGTNLDPFLRTLLNARAGALLHELGYAADPPTP